MWNEKVIIPCNISVGCPMRAIADHQSEGSDILIQRQEQAHAYWWGVY